MRPNPFMAILMVIGKCRKGEAGKTDDFTLIVRRHYHVGALRGSSVPRPGGLFAAPFPSVDHRAAGSSSHPADRAAAAGARASAAQGRCGAAVRRAITTRAATCGYL